MNLKNLLSEVTSVTKQLSNRDVNRVVELVLLAKKIYVLGEGRSGLMAKAFAMRLARMEKSVYVVGETVTPPITAGDLMVTISGSGETKSILQTAKISRMLKATIISLTASPESALANISHELIYIPSELPKRLGHVYQLRELIGVPERPPLASVFEIASLLFLEVVAFKLEERWGKGKKRKQLLPS